MRLRSIEFTLLAMFVAACATSGHRSAASDSSAKNTSSASASGREIFSAEQLSATAAANVYDALSALKPEVLTGRGRGAPDVYIGSVKQQTGLDRLKELSLSAIRGVTYFRYDQARSFTDAQSAGGAIVITLQ